MNRSFVPKWDINGGALAYTLSYAVYFVLLLAFIKWKIGVLPLTKKMLAVSAIILVMFGLNWLWMLAITPWFAGLFTKPIYGLVIDGIIKTAVFLLLGTTTVYKLKISMSVNDLIDKGLKLIHLK